MGYNGSGVAMQAPIVFAWEKWFAWCPVDVNGRKVWLRTVYRKRGKIRLTTSGMSVGWVYGDLFDVLKETERYEGVAMQRPPPPPPPRKP